MTDQTSTFDQSVAGNRAARRDAARRARKLAAVGSGALLATGVASGALATFASSAGAATITVTNTNDAGAGSLRQALADANPGDVIDLTGLSGAITLTTGQLEIDDAVTITGPGPSVLSIDGNGASRVFQMDEDLGGGTVTISGVTITGGNAGDNQGGGINFYCDFGAGSLVLDDVAVTNNQSEDLGGGLYFDRCGSAADLTITNSVFSGNTSTADDGGAIWFDEGDTLTIQNSTFDGNHSQYSGGAIMFDTSQTLLVTNSTFSNNSAGPSNEGSADGGAISFDELQGTATIANSTFSGNNAADNGGAIAVFSGTLALDQVTISGNTAGGGGDGLYFGYANDAEVRASSRQAADGGPSAQAIGESTLSGTIVAGNADGSDDVSGAPEGGNTATISASVIGTVTGVAVTDGGGNQNGVTNPGLAPLASNGGATQTMALVEGSPAIDHGPDPVADFPGNEFDQRGAGFARVVNGRVDVGAFEVQAPAPGPAPAPLVITPRFTG
jgi:predicted outer membrane repeat protein